MNWTYPDIVAKLKGLRGGGRKGENISVSRRREENKGRGKEGKRKGEGKGENKPVSR